MHTSVPPTGASCRFTRSYRLRTLAFDRDTPAPRAGEASVGFQGRSSGGFPDVPQQPQDAGESRATGCLAATHPTNHSPAASPEAAAISEGLKQPAEPARVPPSPPPGRAALRAPLAPGLPSLRPSPLPSTATIRRGRRRQSPRAAAGWRLQAPARSTLQRPTGPPGGGDSLSGGRASSTSTHPRPDVTRAAEGHSGCARATG